MRSRGLFSNMFIVTTYNKIYVHNHSLIIETVCFELFHLTKSKLSNYLIVNILLSCSITIKYTCKAMAKCQLK